ncbi:MAG: FG-GAP repeat domain-containing protein [Bacillota bacterium]
MVVTVAAGNWDTSSADNATAKGAHAGIYLYVTNPVTGATSSVKPLLKTDSFIGNIGRYQEEDFSEAPYQLQNYLQVETGDFDGDGIDEIVVYIPQGGGGGSATSNSRVEVYKLNYTSTPGDTPESNYLNMGKWEKAWTYSFFEGYYVSNMVSLLAGDFNRDGTDDLAMTWGVYYSKDYKNNSKAVILYGDDKNKMLQKDKWFDLSYGNSQIVRAAFAYGDVNGDNTSEVILGGQSEDDINNGIMDTRIINMYTYNGDLDSFIPYSSNNFNLVEFEDENGEMQPRGDGKYYSSPAMAANIAAVRLGGKALTITFT